jgi:hypothetical protein
MKNAKSVTAFTFLVMLYVSVACVQYDVATRFGTLFSVFTSIFGLYVLLLGALFRAPEGYEDKTGFHIGAPAHRASHIFVISGSRG